MPIENNEDLFVQIFAYNASFQASDKQTLCSIELLVNMSDNVP
jgi:hypothetical protein